MDVHENDISTATLNDKSFLNELTFCNKGLPSIASSSLDRLKNSDFRQARINSGSGAHGNSMESDGDKKPAAKSCRSTRARSGILKQRIGVSSDCVLNRLPLHLLASRKYSRLVRVVDASMFSPLY